MTIKDNHINRYGEQHIRASQLVEDELGMRRDKVGLEYDWSHDPRSVSAYEKHLRKGPRGWPTDEVIKQKVSLALYLSPYVDATNIRVNVQNGVVELEGAVLSREQKKAAENCIEFLPGIKDVFNKLMLKVE